MTEKEKAKSLFDEYYKALTGFVDAENGLERGERYEILAPIAKKCAKDSIDKIVYFNGSLFFPEDSLQYDYLQGVKYEIEKI